MNKKNIVILNANISRLRLILSFFFFFICGLLILNTGIRFFYFSSSLIGIMVIYNGFSDIIKYIFSSKNNNKLSITSGVIDIILGALIFPFQNIGIVLIPIIFGLYSMLNALIKAVVIYTYKKSEVPYFFVIIECSLFFIIGILMVFSPLIHINELMIFIGIYCILFSFTFLFDFFREVTPPSIKTKIKAKINISVPVILTAMIPYKALKSVNEYLNAQNIVTQAPDDIPDYEEKNIDEEPDFEIFIHVTEKGFGTIGHMDIIFDGKFISYGNYDDSSLKFFESIGDGVLFIADKASYIPFCIKTSQKTLFSFGIKLNKKEKEVIKKRLDNILKNTYVWSPPVIEDINKLGKENIDINNYTDYASQLSITTNAKIFKFKSSKFKTYFVLGTNCGFLVDTLLRGHDTNIVNFTGIISPGAYLDFLNKEFYRKNSKVITKRIYS